MVLYHNFINFCEVIHILIVALNSISKLPLKFEAFIRILQAIELGDCPNMQMTFFTCKLRS